jgi:glyoxalase family protein
MDRKIHGIHHVTCICGDAQQNLDFYVGVLGMRLVKRSVNQDDTATYHLFYADGAGTPGTDLTFFPWPGMGPAQPGTGATTEINLAVPAHSLEFWQQRLAAKGVTTSAIEVRFGESNLPFADPHGLRLTLVESADEREFVSPPQSPVPSQFQVRGMHSVRLCERSLAPTEAALTLLGFAPMGEENGWHRFGVEKGASGQIVEVRPASDEARARGGVGGVHHVAWRTKDVDEEMEIRALIGHSGLQPTPLIDRFWFQSVYFREPGGVLFELATDGPGFAVDEDAAHLGETLVLPPWLEARRSIIEAGLPPLHLPDSSPEAAA